MLFLCGDVMTGRGIDQVLPFPSDPQLHESYARSALEYVELAARANGAVSAPVSFEYVWGDALPELERAATDVRIINLETSVTTSGAWQPKGINYRMHPRNVPCLTAPGIDCCVLANNHVLDWGHAGLDETLTALRLADLRTAGAGYGVDEAWAPAVLDSHAGRVLVFGFAVECSGVPAAWDAAEGLGVSFLPDTSGATADRVVAHIGAHRRPGDVVVVSIHWGSNWGYRVPTTHSSFAHRLIASGAVDAIHGHSSHHPRGIEVFEGKPILYGCGDFVNDYEGISGHEAYRGDLVLMYFLELSAAGLTRLRMIPMQLRRFRLWRASASDASWLRGTLDRESSVFGTRVRSAVDGALEASWR